MALRADNRVIRAIMLVAIACTAIAACGLMLLPGEAAAAKAKKSAKAKRLPTVKSFSPTTVMIGEVLTIKGKNFTLGKKKMLVIFKRAGSRRYMVKGTATTKTEMTVIVPDLSFDMARSTDDETNGYKPTVFPIRLVNKYGMMKKATPIEKSPTIAPFIMVGKGEDCDFDLLSNDVDTDDDNDLLPDTIETTIGTDKCDFDTDGDYVSDYYEYTVASDFNGGPILPFPWKRPTPDPLASDGGNDLDGDGLYMVEEYHLWRYTGRMDRFYSDAHSDSDGNGTADGSEDEDHDLLANLVELRVFIGRGPLRETSFIDTDSDGDGLCDGLDDLDHDGEAIPVSVGDCSSPVPNNVTPGDPDPSLVDGDDNNCSNIGELLNGTDPYDDADYAPGQYCGTNMPR